MEEKILSVSVLGYENNLNKNFGNIRKIIEAGADWLHVDAMRHPFIPGKATFSEELIGKLYQEFGQDIPFDIHLMVSNPPLFVRTINDTVRDGKRGGTMVTIHREIYRQGSRDGRYASKEYDLLAVDTGDPSLNENLREINNTSSGMVYATLAALKGYGYKTGLALEPGTSLENITDEMVAVMDMILLMGVSSGAGGQQFHQSVLEKIREAQRYGKMIQVDGGVNEQTIQPILEAGAHNLVVGSSITKDRDPANIVKQIKAQFSNP